MLQEENGPFAIFARLQAWIAKKSDKPGGINDGFFCFYCLSMWIALPFAAWYTHNGIDFITFWFAVSALAVFINMAHNKHYQ